jgi:Fe-S cluster assembly iron-binding protein IscA
MLELTESAKVAVRDMVAAEDAPEGSGLRIASDPSSDGDAALSLEIAPEPVAGDAVVDEGEARVFLDSGAATLLDDKVLDAESHDDHFHFVVGEQGGDVEE